MTKQKKILFTSIALVCASVLTIGLVWRGNRKTESPTIQQPTTQNGNMITGDVEENGIRLMMSRTLKASAGTSTAATEVVEINATLSGVGSNYDDDLTWAMTFQTGSAWAMGKNCSDYVTMSIASDTHSVTLECNQPFGEPIIVTAVSKDNTDATASCQLDYVKRVISITGWTTNKGTEHENELRMGVENTITATATYGVGTIDPTITFTSMKLKEDAAVLAAFSTVVPMNSSNWGSGIEQYNIMAANSGVVSGTFTSRPYKFYNGPVADASRLINNFMCKYATGKGCGLVLKPILEATVSYGDTVYQNLTFETEQAMALEKGNLTQSVTVNDVTFDKPNVIF